MSDLLNQLREYESDEYQPDYYAEELIEKAADRIASLEKELSEREWVSINTFETDSYSYRLQRMKLPPAPQEK